MTIIQYNCKYGERGTYRDQSRGGHSWSVFTAAPLTTQTPPDGLVRVLVAQPEAGCVLYYFVGGRTSNTLNLDAKTFVRFVLAVKWGQPFV